MNEAFPFSLFIEGTNEKTTKSDRGKGLRFDFSLGMPIQMHTGGYIWSKNLTRGKGVLQKVQKYKNYSEEN